MFSTAAGRSLKVADCGGQGFDSLEPSGEIGKFLGELYKLLSSLLRQIGESFGELLVSRIRHGIEW